MYGHHHREIGTIPFLRCSERKRIAVDELQTIVIR
jgi:hypothetical protein